jgi:DNA-binding CsgD family transcriptional regulator/uncharacterized protein YuzE
MNYSFEHDPKSGAIYVRVKEGEIAETIPLADPGFGAAVDVDGEGNVLGFEFLSFEEYAEIVRRAGGRLQVPDRVGGLAEDPGALAALVSLTPREREVLRLLAEGRTNREIAEQLLVSSTTVRQHIRNVLNALGVRSQDEARTLLTR